jgi:hypothetical protein
MTASIRHSAAYSPGFRNAHQDADARDRSAFGFPHQFEVTRSISCGFHVNAGYEYVKSPTPNASSSPAIPGSNRSISSAGSGQHVDRLSSALALPSICARTGAVSLGALADGTHAFDSNATTLSLGNYF